jgi:hypothetical protein
MSELLEDDTPGDIRRVIYHYRRAGEPLAAIAQRMGISVSRVTKYYRDYITELAKYVTVEDHRVALLEENARLDILQSSFWDQATDGQDKDAAKFVLDVMRLRADLNGLKQMNPADREVVHKVLVISQDKSSFLEALAMGQRGELMSGDPDNDIVGEVSQEEALG